MKTKDLALLGAALGAAIPAGAKQRPNIIFFLVDDYGWVDSEVHYDGNAYPRHGFFHTPNMVRMAEKGVVFSNAYACPVSTPTRTSIMSGMNSAHTGITNWTANPPDTPSDEENKVLGRPQWTLSGLSPVPGVPNTQYATPLVQQLRDAGYFTIHVGKAHWGSWGTPGASPYNMGFVVNISGSINGMPTSYYSQDHFGNTPEKWDYMSIQNLAEYYDTGTDLTEALTREALKTLSYPIEHKQPFYLYMAHYGVHLPAMKDPRFYDRYRSMGLDEGCSTYSSMVEAVDKSLGDIMDFLDREGIADNTIIVFYSDNGGNANVKAKGQEPHMQNLPLREGKASCYLGGIRVPMMLYWPGKTHAGTRVDVPVQPEDFYPSILEMAGLKKYSHEQPLDGVSFVQPAIKGNAAGDLDRVVVQHYPHQWKPKYKPEIDFMSTIVRGEWKLVFRQMNTVESKLKDGEPFELYNIARDLGETTDVAAQNPAIVAELATLLGRQLREWNAPMPVVKATGKTVPYPDELVK